MKGFQRVVVGLSLGVLGGLMMGCGGSWGDSFVSDDEDDGDDDDGGDGIGAGMVVVVVVVGVGVGVVGGMV